MVPVAGTRSPIGEAVGNFPSSPVAASCDCGSSLFHRAPDSGQSTESTQSSRNTVHWDSSTLDASTKENTALETRHIRRRTSKAGVGGQTRETLTCQEEVLFDFDLGNKKSRGGHQRRAPLGAETFVAPETAAEVVGSTSSSASTSTSTSASTYDKDKDPFGDHKLIKAARDLEPADSVFAKHRKKQYQWVLSLPALTDSVPDQPKLLHKLPGSRPSSLTRGQDDGGSRRYFGCNLLTWTKPGGKESQSCGRAEHRYLLLATPIDWKADYTHTAHSESTARQSRTLQQQTEKNERTASQAMTSPASAASSVSAPGPAKPQKSTTDTTTDTADTARDGDHGLTLEAYRERKAPSSMIEDYFEELDQLEDEVEAISAATSLTRLVDQDENMLGPRSPAVTEGKRNVATQQATTKAHVQTPTKGQTGQPLPRSSVGKASSSCVTEAEHDGEKTRRKTTTTMTPTPTPTTAAGRRVARPASLAPPKPLQKVSKPPTISTFELPGEKVAKELKEKKAARLSLMVDPHKAGLAQGSSSPRWARSVRSSKPPTVPNFELPGEAYSRTKRERLEAKLRAEEEAIRQRRQFKARPPPSSVLLSCATVRSTFTSRQRESQAGSEEQGKVRAAGAPASSSSSNNNNNNNNNNNKPGAGKRQSMTMTPSMVRAVCHASGSGVSPGAKTGRGRASSVESSHMSTRGTSSSNGSVASASKRSQVSVEKMQQQKARGREVYTRDHSYGQDKEREQRERQHAVQLARQKYAEQSRVLATSRRMKQQQQQCSSTGPEVRVG